jgi:hypothetical protein
VRPPTKGRAAGQEQPAGGVTERPAPRDRLEHPEAVLSRSDVGQLGYERRAVDAIFRACPIISLPGYSRPLLRVSDFRAFLDEHTYAADRVRPT